MAAKLKKEIRNEAITAPNFLYKYRHRQATTCHRHPISRAVLLKAGKDLPVIRYTKRVVYVMTDKFIGQIDAKHSHPDVP